MCLLIISLFFLSALSNFNLVQCTKYNETCKAPSSCFSSSSSIKGVCPPVYIPFNKDGEVNYKVIPQYLRYLKDNGISCIIVSTANTGAFVQSYEERCDSAVAFVKEGVALGFTVLTEVGGQSVGDAIEMAKSVTAAGAEAVTLEARTLLVFNNTVDLVKYICLIGKYAKQVLYYDNPTLTGNNQYVPKLWDVAVATCPHKFGGMITNLRNFLATRGSAKSYTPSSKRSILVYDFLYSGSASAYGANGVADVIINTFPAQSVQIRNLVKEQRYLEAINLQLCLNQMVTKITSKPSLEKLDKTALKDLYPLYREMAIVSSGINLRFPSSTIEPSSEIKEYITVTLSVGLKKCGCK